MSDIATEAGVSVATVSKVLNGSDRVSQETRSRVQDLLSERNYERRPAARTGPAPIVDLVLREVSNPWAIEIIAGAVEAARRMHATVAVNVLPDTGGHGSWLDDISARGTKGVIVLLARLSDREKAALRSRGIPLAVIDPRGEPDPSVPTVGATNWSGAYAATRHLAELGHQRIAIISGPRDLFCSHARMDGYRSAMEAAGLPVDPDLMRWGDFHVEAAFKHATAMLSMEDRPTAIFVGSDLQAMGVIGGGSPRPPASASAVEPRRLRRYPVVALDVSAAHVGPSTIGRDGGHRGPGSSCLIGKRGATKTGASSWLPRWWCARARHHRHAP